MTSVWTVFDTQTTESAIIECLSQQSETWARWHKSKVSAEDKFAHEVVETNWKRWANFSYRMNRRGHIFGLLLSSCHSTNWFLTFSCHLATAPCCASCVWFAAHMNCATLWALSQPQGLLQLCSCTERSSMNDFLQKPKTEISAPSDTKSDKLDQKGWSRPLVLAWKCRGNLIAKTGVSASSDTKSDKLDQKGWSRPLVPAWKCRGNLIAKTGASASSDTKSDNHQVKRSLF